MRSFLSMCLLCVCAAVSGSGQTVTRNWKNRAEYNLYDRIAKEPSATETLKLLLEWKKQYPDTDFPQERLEWFVRTYDAAGMGDETYTAAKELFQLDPSNLMADWALCYWTPRLKDPPADAAAIVKKAATVILARLDDISAKYSTRRNMDSLFEGIETGKPAKTEQATNPQMKWRAEAEQDARQALDWAAAH